MIATLLCLLATPSMAAESGSKAKLHLSPATAQSLVVEALRRTQSEFADDACLTSVTVDAGLSYLDNKSHNSKVNENFYYDQFRFGFRSPKRKGSLIQFWCEPAGEVGVLGGPCFGGMSKWWSEDKAHGGHSPCLDELSFDSDKAVHRAYEKGVIALNGRIGGILEIRGGPLKGKRKTLVGKPAWVFSDNHEKRCLALHAKDGRELFDGPCDGLR